ncbi:MAG: response regulator [Deltaproteobacteria bacterium]|nr:response regulator [Deltaproteobacteria bacterium]TLN05061.1 MAG: response regulator [bacterium]
MEKLRILINEDLPSDVELLEYEIRKGGFNFISTRVDSRERFLAALDEFDPDLIISDFNLPSFTGMQALSLVREHSPFVPLIIVTGALNEEIAVECMKAGADDYVLKDNLKRLVPAIGVVMANSKARKERVLAEEQSASSERKMRAVFEHAHDAICILHEGFFIDCNPMAEKLFNVVRDDLLQRSLSEFFPVEQACGQLSQELAAEKFRKALAGEPQNFEWLLQRLDGTVFDVDVGLSPIEVDGRLHLMAILRDITEKKRIEREMLENERKYKDLSQEFNTLLDAIPDPILLQSPGLEIVWANKSAMSQFSEGAENLEERHCFKLLHQISAPHEGCPVLESFATGKPAKGIIPMTDRVWEIRAVPVINENGTIVNVIEIGRDITEMKKLEQQLLHAQKMEVVGQLSGGIAHDFNNIVTAIIGYGNLILMKLPEDDPARHFVEQILVTADRAAELTQGLLAFSRKRVLNMKPVQLNDIISGFRSFLGRIIGEQIMISTDLLDAPVFVYADSSQIEQVLMNLATNARDAMPDGGTISISLETSVLDGAFIKSHGYGEPGKYACILVSDTGGGMDEDTLKKIFEPFFTTKEAGKGTGLGLSIAYGIVKEHNGYILASSQPGNGTTFRIYLPVIKNVEQRPEIPHYREPQGGHETILIAEDDSPVREITAKLLTGYGYSVIEAEDGDDALKKFAEARDAVQLLILDVLMPGKNGREVAEALRQLSPEVKVLFTSGYPLDLLVNKNILPDDVHFFIKPIAPRELLRKVREVLEG